MANITQKLNTQKIPKLRFMGFSGNWEEKKLGEIAFFTKGKGISKDDTVENGKNKCIRYGELYTQYKEIIKEVYSSTNILPTNSFLSKKDDVIIPSSGETALDIATTSCVKNSGILLGGDINILRFNLNYSGDFFSYYLKNFKNRDIARLAQGQSVVHLYSSQLKDLTLNTPSLTEQQKIAGFLGSVDEWINILKNQKESLESYKKGIMQKIFSQEIRFKNNKGNDFSEWKLKTLSDIGQAYNGLQGKSGEDFGGGEAFITYKQIFDSSEIDITKNAYVRVLADERQNKTQFGDVFFTSSSETPEEVGFSSVLLDKNITPYLNSFSFGLRPNSLKELDPYFAKFFFRSPLFRKDVVKLAQGSTRYNISKNEFMKIKFLLPSILEQKEIADFLISVDSMIESKQQQVIQAEGWKKGLMQGLFI
jgi:type I restriction enzyme, S subunit